MAIELICVDADDTLWHNQPIFDDAAARFEALLAPYTDGSLARLEALEARNLAFYGYGLKGFTLSMIETAVELTGGAVPGRVIGDILQLGREMLHHAITPLEGVAAALDALAARGRLVLVTKGDLFDQEAKLAASGLGDRFSGVEVVSTKDAATYGRVFARHGAAPEQAVMAGNSVRSDILPALEAGAFAAYIPYPLVWSHEAAEVPTGHERFRELAALGELADWIDEPGG